MPRRTSSRPPEVFLSHSSSNAAFVERLATMLAAHDVRFFLSRRHIGGADEWHDAIGDALKRCDWFLVVLSPEAVRSMWVKRELLYALRDERLHSRIIPALYKTCDMGSLSWTLPALQWVDFRGNFEEGSRQLLKIWKIPQR